MNIPNILKNRSGGKALKAGIGYTVGNFLVKGITFLTLPLFSRLMTTAQFGSYNVFVSYEAILYVIIGLAIHTSVQSANLEFKGEISDYVSSVSLIYIINALFLSSVVFIASEPLTGIMNFSKGVLWLLILYSLGTSLMQLYNNKISLNYDYKKYLAVSLTYSAGSVILSLILMFLMKTGERDLSRMIGTSTAAMAAAVFILVSFYSDAVPKYEKKYWSFAVKYSLPIVPHGIAQVLLAQFDRIMIRHMIGNAEAGIYSLAANIKLILTVITTSIATAWRTWFYRTMSEGKKNEIQKRAGQILLGYAALTVLLACGSKEIVLILGGKSYEMAKYVAVPMIADAFLLFVYNIIVQSEYYAKKTHYVMFGTLAAAVINVITNYIFIKMYGFIAAAYTTLFSYAVFLALHLYISRKTAGFVIIKPKRLVFAMAIVCAVSVISIVFVDSLPIRALTAMAAVVVLVLTLYKDMGRESYA